MHKFGEHNYVEIITVFDMCQISSSYGLLYYLNFKRINLVKTPFQ